MIQHIQLSRNFREQKYFANSKKTFARVSNTTRTGFRNWNSLQGPLDRLPYKIIYIYIRRPRQTQGGARQGIRHLKTFDPCRTTTTTITTTTTTTTTTTITTTTTSGVAFWTEGVAGAEAAAAAGGKSS